MAAKKAVVKTKKSVCKKDAYSVSGDSINRTKPVCPKCGPGVFMASHSDRTSCGHCGYTEFAKKN